MIAYTQINLLGLPHMKVDVLITSFVTSHPSPAFPFDMRCIILFSALRRHLCMDEAHHDTLVRVTSALSKQTALERRSSRNGIGGYYWHNPSIFRTDILSSQHSITNPAISQQSLFQ